MDQFDIEETNITEFLRNTLSNDKWKLIREFTATAEEYNYKFEPTTAELPEEIMYQCPILSASIYYNAVKSFEHIVASEDTKINGTDSWGCGPVHMAARCGRINILSHEAFQKANFSALEWRGRSPIFFAAEFNHLDCLTYLVEQKQCDISMEDKFGLTPLHVACEKGNIEIIQYIIEHGGQMKLDKLGRSPIEVAAEKGQVETLKYFATRDQSILAGSNANGRNLLHIAASTGFVEEIQYLATINGLDVNKIDNYGMAPLHYAAENADHVVIESLYNVPGIQKEIKTPDGNTPIHIASLYSNKNALTGIISPNPDLNDIRNNASETALHLACSSGNLEIVEYLVDSGVDVNTPDGKGLLPRDRAHGSFSKEIINSLKGKKHIDLIKSGLNNPHTAPALIAQPNERSSSNQSSASSCNVF